MYSYIEIIQENNVSFLHFYLKRLGRLFPVMAMGAIGYEVLLVIYEYVYHETWSGITPTFWGTIIASLGIQDGWALPNPCVNNPTWYISVLLLCYVIFYSIVHISNRWKICPQYIFVFMIFLGMGIQNFGINLPFLNASSARGYYAFFFGILLADLLKKKEINIKWMLISMVLLVCITTMIVFIPTFMEKGINYIMTFIYYPALIIFCKTPIVDKILNRKVFGEIGRISFDVYIWHSPFFILMFILIKIFKWNLNLNCYWTMIGYAIICYAFGTISHYFIERPLNKMLINKIESIKID